MGLKSRFVRILMFSTFLIVCSAFAANAADIYVSNTGDDGTGDGSAGAPFLSVQYAIGQASQGDTIRIGSGTYSESLGILKDDITIIGEGNPKPVIRRPDGIGGATIRIEGQGTRIRNLGITNSTEGIAFSGSSFSVTGEVEISSCDFDCSNYEIWIGPDFAGSSLTIKGNTFSESSCGIYFSGFLGPGASAPTIEVSGNRFGTHTMSAIYNLILLTGQMQISGNQFPGCPDYAIDVVNVNPGAELLIQSNDIEGTEGNLDTAIDIDIYGASGGTVRLLNNVIRGPFYKGISVNEANASTLEIRGNFISGCDQALYVWNLFEQSAGTLSLTENLFYDNSTKGVFLDGGQLVLSSSLTVQSNDIMSNDIGLEYQPEYSESLDATDNWWGDASGPYHPVSNDLGMGNEVSDNVLFDPWGTTRYTSFSLETPEDPVPPDKAMAPLPADGATVVVVDPMLSWEASGDSFALYFGTDSADLGEPLAEGLTATSYDIGAELSLDFLTTYYWRVDVTSGDLMTSGDVWSFTTESEGLLPGEEPVGGSGGCSVGTLVPAGLLLLAPLAMCLKR